MYEVIKLKNMKLTNAIELVKGDMVTVVGAGGKTSIIIQLCKEIINRGVIITTTTHITQLNQINNYEIMINNTKDINREIKKIWNRDKLADIVIGKSRMQVSLSDFTSVKKIKGISCELVDKINCFYPEVNIFVEGDGAARKHIKTPADYEPVVPRKTDILIPVMGMSALGKKINKKYCHRIKLLKKLNNGNEKITEELIIKILTYKSCYGFYWGYFNKYIPVFNQVSENNYNRVKGLAEKLVNLGIEKVILINTRNQSPVIEIVN